MAGRRFLRTCLAACVVIACAGESASAQGMAVPWTALAEIDIRPPDVTGSIWLAADAIETLMPIDTDGDVSFSRDELERARPWLMRYINEHFRIMWQGRVQPILVTSVESDRREAASRRYLRATFRVRDYPPGMEVIILSELLNDLSPRPSCMALIRYKQRQEVFVFGAEHYYTTHPSRWVAEDDGVYRPPSRRGRITPSATAPIEMLFAKPENAFYLYCVAPDRYTPRPIASEAVAVRIATAGEAKPREAVLTLKAMPLPGDPAGRASRFRAEAADWADVESFKADLTLGEGQDRRRIIFDFPAVAIEPTAAPAEAPRYACPRLCLGVESPEGGSHCPRCGAALIAACGDRVPGVGSMGLHGGPMTSLNAAGDWVELVFVAPRELRLYRTSVWMEERPIGALAGFAMPFRSEQTEGPPPRLQFARDAEGRYLSAMLSGPMFLPGGVRCILTDGESPEPILLEFQVWEMLEERPAVTQPVTPPPAMPVAPNG